MGTFTWPMTVSNLDGQHSQTVDATVDTGAFFTMLPGNMLRQMGVAPLETVELELADRTRIERDIGHVWVSLQGHADRNGNSRDDRAITLAIFGDDDSPVLLGAYTLEGLRLAVDTVQQKLVPANLILY